MTAKSFCYASLGVFLLVAAWTMGARHAEADWDSSQQGHVHGFAHLEIDTGYVVRSDGSMWIVNYSGWHELPSAYSLPIPPDEIKFFGGTIIVTKSGDAWIFENSTWINRGQIPPPTVAVEPSTSSAMKAKYREED